MPSLQQLRYLVAVADTLHFRRAAEICNVTQPTLSAQIKELELRLGVTLIERSTARVFLTAVGVEISERARRVLRDVEDIRETARISQRRLSGTIRAGVVRSLGSYLFPLIVPEIHETYPGLGLYLREGLAEDLIHRLEGGALDLLFFPMPLERKDIVTVALFDEPLQVVLPYDHPLAQKDAVQAEDLSGETLLTLERGHRLYDEISDLALRLKADLSHDYESTSLDTLRQMVAMGMGISLLPSLYVRSEVAREHLVVARPFKGQAPKRTIAMAWRNGTARTQDYFELAQLTRHILLRDAPEVTVIDNEIASM